MSIPENSTAHEVSDGFDFGLIFRLIMMQSKLILLFVFSVTSLAIYNYISSDRVYKINSLIQVYGNNQQLGLGSSSNFDFMLGSSNTSDINNVETLYKTRTNLIEAIESKNMNLKIDDFSYSKDFIINLKPKDEQNTIFELSLQEEVYSVKFRDQNFPNIKFNEAFSNGHFEILLNENAPKNQELKISYENPNNTYKIVKNSFSFVSSVPQSIYGIRNSGLLEISFLTKDVREGINFLDYVNNKFLLDNVEIESEAARKAIGFIDERSDNVLDQLNIYKNQLKSFRESNKSINVDLEIQNIIETLSDLETKINNVDIEIDKASVNYTELNPVYNELISQKNILVRQKESIEAKIVELPLAQQEFIDIFKNVEMTQEAYNELLNKRLEFSIKEASTLGNMRIVDDAYYDRVVSPTFFIVLFAGFLSFVFALVIAIIRGLYFLPISNPAEFADNNINIPIFGVIPKIQAQDIMDSKDEEAFLQSLENIIVNIKSNIDQESNRCKTILITSATASNGKSFTAQNIAKKLSKINKRVLLIDCDMKRGDLHKSFNKKKITTSDFEDITAENLKDLAIDDYLFLLPKVTSVTSSFRFLYSSLFAEKLSMFQENFDYIVFDTAPSLSVSDTSVLMALADLNLFIARHGITKINETKQVLQMADQLGKRFDGIIYNFYEKPSSYYGYYGLYGNYSYQYYAKKYLYNNYDYEK